MLGGKETVWQTHDLHGVTQSWLGVEGPRIVGSHSSTFYIHTCINVVCIHTRMSIAPPTVRGA